MRESVAHNGKNAAVWLKSSLEKFREFDTSAQKQLKDIQTKLLRTYVDQFKEFRHEIGQKETEIRRLHARIDRISALSEKEKSGLTEKYEAQIDSLKAKVQGEQERLEKFKARKDGELDKLRALVQEADESSLSKVEDIQRKQAQIENLEARVSSLQSELSKAKTKEGKTKIVRKLPKRPDRIDFEYRRNEMGLISMVTMKAEGYSDIVVDVVRGSNHRFKEMEIKVK